MDGKVVSNLRSSIWVVVVAAFALGPIARAEEAVEKFATDSAGSQQQQERYVPGTLRALAGATLELKSEATIVGAEVRLKQVCRWSEAEKAAFEPVADLVIARMGASMPFRAMTLTELKSTLRDAGVNLALIRFAGATNCTITRTDVQADERTALQDWVNARLAQGAATQPAERPAAAAVAVVRQTPVATRDGAAQTAAMVQPAVLQPAVAKVAEEPRSYHTLKELIVADLAERLQLDPVNVQVKFNPVDERVLSLSEPLFKFNVDGSRVRNLGNVSWDVTIFSDGPKDGPKGTTQKTTINAAASAWQDQLVAIRPMAYHQPIRAEDLLSRRALVHELDSDLPLGKDQVVGQLAGRELRAGTILTGQVVEAAPLAKSGDLVTVTLDQGNVQIITVVRAMEGGTYGQTIHARNEATGVVYDVTLTGPKAGRMLPVAAPEAATANVAN